MKRYRAYFVDIDNTLLDFDEYVRTSMIEGFRHFGLKPYEEWMYEVFHTENNKLWRALEKKELTFEELIKIRWNMIFNALEIDFDGPTFEKYFREFLNQSAIPVKGAEELLKYLKNCGIVCSASNGPFFQQTHRLELAGFDRFTDYQFISEDLGASKPAKAFFEESFRRLNEGRSEGELIRPEECLMIGDSLTSDMAGGIAYGMDTCFYDRKGNGDTKGAEVTYIVTELSEIPKLLEEL